MISENVTTGTIPNGLFFNVIRRDIEQIRWLTLDGVEVGRLIRGEDRRPVMVGKRIDEGPRVEEITYNGKNPEGEAR